MTLTYYVVHSRVSESPFYPELTVKSIHLAAGAIHYGKLKTFLLLQSQVLVIENLKAVLSCVIPGTCITNSNNLDITTSIIGVKLVKSIKRLLCLISRETLMLVYILTHSVLTQVIYNPITAMEFLTMLTF